MGDEALRVDRDIESREKENATRVRGRDAVAMTVHKTVAFTNSATPPDEKWGRQDSNLQMLVSSMRLRSVRKGGKKDGRREW